MQAMQFNQSQYQQLKKINEQNTYQTTSRNSLTAAVGGSGQLTPVVGTADTMASNPYRSFNVNTLDSQASFNLKKQPGELQIEEYQSEQNVALKS